MSLLSQTRSYAKAFAEMTPETVCELTSFLSEDVIFTDPFNKLHGHAAFTAIFDHMFAVMMNPRFEILDVACSDRAGYIKWRMTGALKARPSFTIDLTGMSEIEFDESGLVTAHYDHWDSAHQVLARLPGIGWLVRRLLKLFALPTKMLSDRS